MDQNQKRKETLSLRKHTLALITICLNDKVHCEASAYRRREAKVTAMHEDKW
jgi:hypothetical protein